MYLGLVRGWCRCYLGLVRGFFSVGLGVILSWFKIYVGFVCPVFKFGLVQDLCGIGLWFIWVCLGSI